MSVRGIQLILLGIWIVGEILLCGIEPRGFISDGVSYLSFQKRLGRLEKYFFPKLVILKYTANDKMFLK